MSDISQETIEAAAALMSIDREDRHGCGTYANDDELLADAWPVIDWAVARLAADRAERDERARPIDAEWLESIGCKKMAINRWKIQEQIRVNVWLVECVRWMVRIDGWLVQMHTRGQLLDLLRVLKGGDA